VFRMRYKLNYCILFTRDSLFEGLIHFPGNPGHNGAFSLDRIDRPNYVSVYTRFAGSQVLRPAPPSLRMKRTDDIDPSSFMHG
jgi:hypothetical protein